MTHKTYSVLLAALVLAGFGLFAAEAEASHAWGEYHWARTSNPFSLRLGDNVSSSWDAYLRSASANWSASSVLDTVVAPGSTSAKTCRSSSGRVEVCSSKYGSNGWLGIASIWTSGVHITRGTVKVNDSYFNTARFNTPAWRNLVMCQEIGHIFGLDHQDEDFENAPLGTCMDYSSDPTMNQHPDKHDFDMLEAIYEHLDSETTVSQTTLSNRREVDTSDQSSWGTKIRSSSGRRALFERDFGDGSKLFTFVIWANE